MTGHAQLLSKFIDDWNAGRRPAVDVFVSRAREDERAALEDAIAAFLETAPLPRYDEPALAAIRAEPGVRALADAVRGQDPWTELLPRLRRRRGLAPADLAAAVRNAFGLGEEDATRARDYIERLEAGELGSARLSRRLVTALAGALGVPAATLESARAAWSPAPAGGKLLWRAEDDRQEELATHLDTLAHALRPPADEVERLFTGGPGA